jgi:inosine triphosphate pyrophosphatase
MLYFITGNKNKFNDAKTALPKLEQLDIDLPEIQELDAKVIIKAKLMEAFKHHSGEFIVDDVSMHLEGLGGFPGPLVKWFMKALKQDGIANLLDKIGNSKAEVKAIIGYAKSPEEIYFFESSRKGNIVSPRGNGGFGWDVIFQPEGGNQTYAEWKETHPGPNDMRTDVLNQLKDFLDKQHD